MKIERFEFIPGSGLNMMGVETRTVYDAQGNPEEIVVSRQPMAIGLHDFAADPANPTEAEITLGKQKISERLRTLLTDSDADLLAENARLVARAQSVESAKQAVQTELETERAARQATEAALQTERTAKQAVEAELQTERAARQLAESQKEAALAELQRGRV